MTWILPKQLHTLAFALDTEALILDSNKFCQICEQSLMVRSKPMRVQTWLAKLKKDSWMLHLSGRILKPSLGIVFAEKWASCLEDIHANPLVTQENDLEKTTQDTCGLTSQMELDSCDQTFAFLKTCKDTLASDLEKLLANWNQSVIEQRGEYSRRVKSVLLTKEKEFLSWATPTTMDVLPPKSVKALMKERYQDRRNRSQPGNLRDQIAVKEGNSIWPTPCTMEAQKAGNYSKGQMGQSLVAMANRGELNQKLPTPCARDYRDNGLSLAELNRNSVTLATIAGGRLNADWVEWLMGIPTGWTDCDCAETALSQQLPH